MQLLGWCEIGDYIHIAMEYVPHDNLRNYLEMERAESEAKASIRQLLKGLVVIHEAGFAHRDLKPEVRSLHPAANTQLIGFIEHFSGPKISHTGKDRRFWAGKTSRVWYLSVPRGAQGAKLPLRCELIPTVIHQSIQMPETSGNRKRRERAITCFKAFPLVFF